MKLSGSCDIIIFTKYWEIYGFDLFHIRFISYCVNTIFSIYLAYKCTCTTAIIQDATYWGD